MKVLVVGAGAMGRWFAATVTADIVFTDTDSDAARAAAETQDTAHVPPGTDEQFDAVCLAVPISAVADAVEAYAPQAGDAILDVSGVMADPLDAMHEHAPDRERASLHPLFAPENAPGNVAVVTDEGGPVTEALLDDLSAAGNDLFETTAEEHDTAMETVQAGAHTAVLAYALAADDVREEFHTPISSGLADLVETVTGGTPRVYREIQESFAGADDVAQAARRIADAEGTDFDSLYREAGEGFGYDDADHD